MAEHPDLARMRAATREARIRDAWGSTFHTRMLPPNVQTRLDMRVATFQADKQTQVTRRPLPRRETKTPTAGVVAAAPSGRLHRVSVRAKKPRVENTVVENAELGCRAISTSRGCVRFECSSFAQNPSAFSTSSVLLNATLGKGFYTYRSSFIIERDHRGGRLESKVTSPRLYATGDKKTSMPLVREFINKYMLDLYARIMASTRYFLGLNGCELTVPGFDARMREDVCVSTGIDLKLHPTMRWNTEASMMTVVSYCYRISESLCKQLNVPTKMAGSESESGSESGSESESESESDHEFEFW